MYSIAKVNSREILDSRGNPTVEVELVLSSGAKGRAQVPSGASTGAHEAHELRDGTKDRYNGKGVLVAVKNVCEKIAPAVINKSVASQEELDKLLLETDGTENKSKLGANAILGVSMAFAKAVAEERSIPLYKSLAEEIGGESFLLPTPLMNVVNGGAHADNGLDVQEFMIVPVCGGSFREALRAGSEVFHSLKKILLQDKLSTGVGDEGGFAPVLGSNEKALDYICQAISAAGYEPGKDVLLALDVAATELYSDGMYLWEGQKINSQELGAIYDSWASRFPLVSIEDGFSEDDWSGWISYLGQQGDNIQLVGDDLFVTNPARIKRGIQEKAANALLVKVNQIGTLTETFSAIKMAHGAGFNTVMSHRSGETEDVIIADLAVATSSEQIKTGSLCRGERIAKYNQLLRIEEELGPQAKFLGAKSFKIK